MASAPISVDILLADESFQRWVLEDDPAAAHYWEDWLRQYPERLYLVTEARQVLALLSGSPPEAVPDGRADRLWARIADSRASAAGEVPVRPLWSTFARRRFAAAVGLLLLAGAGSWYAFRMTQPLEYATDFGETRPLTLPDGSRVTLNANSRLTLARSWDSATPREVWLEGEAFFSVTHQPHHQRFVVHSDRINVEVVGTEFNVYSRHREVQVVLESGQVRLAAAQRTGALADTVVMQPGHRFEYRSDGRPTLKPAKTERFSAWKDNRLLLEQTSLAELVRLLRENYGLTVRVANDTLLRQTASGSMPIQDEDALLLQISRLFSLKISKEDRMVHIDP
jgi:transmembrane sensor